MHRRDFLDPRLLAQSAGQVLGAATFLTEQEEPLVDGTEINLVRYARSAMATIFEIVFPFGHSLPNQAIYDALDLIDELEGQLTVYRETSEVSQLNGRAQHEEVVVEPNLFELLQLAQTISQATEGAFDITAGALIKAWGFFKGPKHVPSEEELTKALTATGWQHLHLYATQNIVSYGVPGLEINLGSIGKGYTLDQAGLLLTNQWNVESLLLHGGKSSVLGLGAPPGHQGWSVGLEHPWDTHQRLATVYLRDRAMATSAATYKHLVHQGKKLGHILDPRSGWPASGIASATALAPTAAEADALATAFYIMGRDRTKEFCSHHPQISAILLTEGSSRVEAFNVSSQECRFLI